VAAAAMAKNKVAFMSSAPFGLLGRSESTRGQPEPKSSLAQKNF